MGNSNNVNFAERSAVTSMDQLTPEGVKAVGRFMSKGMSQQDALAKLSDIYTGKQKSLFGGVLGARWVNPKATNPQPTGPTAPAEVTLGPAQRAPAATVPQVGGYNEGEQLIKVGDLARTLLRR